MRRANGIAAAIGLAPSAGRTAFAAAAFAGAFCCGPAAANPVSDLLFRISAAEVVILSALIGAITFAVASTITLIRSRDETARENQRLRLEAADLKASAERVEAFIDISGDRLVAFEAPDVPPRAIGVLPPVPGVPEEPAAFVAFNEWLDADSALLLDQAIARLRERGEGFQLPVTTPEGGALEACGRTAGGLALVRFRELTGDRLTVTRLEAQVRSLSETVAAFEAVLDAAGTPAWLRDAAGRLVWVSRRFAEAVDAVSADEAARHGLEFLDAVTRDAIRTGGADGQPVRRRVSAVVGGERRQFDVTAVAGSGVGAGIAIDATEVAAARAALDRLVDFHARTLDQLAAGVAIFGPDRKLRSYNAAYRALFGLDTAFLESMPEDGEILDWLRAERRLPEQADYRTWKADLLSAYLSLETKEQLWVMPDGQKLRVIANPHPDGGVTWIYEDVTERLDLESRYNALIRVQGETLDNLAEAVVVFGSDGRVRLTNPAFAEIWGLDRKRLAERPHVAELIAGCRRLHNREEDWHRLTVAVAGVDEERASVVGRMERLDGKVVDYATIPLPEGQTMVTFVDVTATVHVERALTEKNLALEAADQLKNAFIQHVSYELRSPLTNIIGFAQLMADPKIGQLNEKQREYIGYIMASSDALLAIVNDILDLATVDAGIMELDLGEVDIRAVVVSAVESVRVRMEGARLRLDMRVPRDIGHFIADEKRVRQILYNLLANSVRFSSAGGRVTIGARREGDFIAFMVDDEGAGMPEDFIATAFDRFSSRAGGSSRGGAGLGLSIVRAFVELHGGTVAIRSAEGKGTSVTVRLPVRPAAIIEAAE
jgi:signal transduction histidine kinase